MPTNMHYITLNFTVFLFNTREQMPVEDNARDVEEVAFLNQNLAAAPGAGMSEWSLRSN